MKQTVDEMMLACARDAVVMAKESFNEHLDYSEGSIAAVERCLDRLYMAMPRGFFSKLLRRGWTDERLHTLSMIFGGYIGEVFRRYHNGKWVIEDAPGGGGPIVTMQHAGGGVFFPTTKVYKRLTNGDEDNVWHYYRVLTREYIKSGDDS